MSSQCGRESGLRLRRQAEQRAQDGGGKGVKGKHAHVEIPLVVIAASCANYVTELLLCLLSACANLSSA